MYNFLTPKRLWFVAYLWWISAVVIACICFIFILQPEVSVDDEPMPETRNTVFKNSFVQKKNLHDALTGGLFRLGEIERHLRLPDLRNQLVFFGSNERPDQSMAATYVHYGLRGNTTKYTSPATEKVFFAFDGNKWTASGTPTPLSGKFNLHAGGVEVVIELVADDGTLITTPSEFHRFTLAPVPQPPAARDVHQWEIGEHKVDAALLERMGASWWGKDEVIALFGGEEMAEEAQKERIQFSLGEESYAIYVQEEDCFVFENDQWVGVKPGPDSLGKVLLRAKSIDSRAIIFDAWNGDGSAHMSLTLLKRENMQELKLPPIRLVGALSHKNWIAEIFGKRIMLMPDDWIVLNASGYTKLDTSDRLDDYLGGRLMGNLLVCHGIEKIQGESCLVGCYFDSTRSRQEKISISLYRSWERKEQKLSPVESDEDLDDIDDDEYYFDDEDEDEDDE